MKTIRNALLVASPLCLMLLGDAPKDAPFGFQLVSEAQAVLGVRRRAVRRGVVIGSSMAAADSAAAQSQPAAPPAAAAPPPAAPAATGKPLALGTVVPNLPGGCTETPVGGVEYYYCGGNFYRSAFQGSKLVYVTAKP